MVDNMPLPLPLPVPEKQSTVSAQFENTRSRGPLNVKGAIENAIFVIRGAAMGCLIRCIWCPGCSAFGQGQGQGQGHV